MERKYLFMGTSLEELQESIKYEKKDQFKRLYEICRSYKDVKLAYEHPAKSITFMAMAAANLSLGYILTKQEHYLTEAKRWIFTAVKYPHWGHAFLVDVDLSASWLLFGLSICYDWLKDDLTDKERTLLRNKLVLQADRMFAFKVETEGEGWSTAFWQNHNWINIAGLATAGYALRDEVPKAQEWVDDAKSNFARVFEYMADDGSDYEGVAYWRYGVIWLIIYADLSKQEEGIDYFKTSGFLKETFYYRLYQAVPNLGETVNYGDCHDKRSGHSVATYYKLAAEYDNGYAQYMGNRVLKDFLFREAYESQIKPGILPEAWLELLWFDPNVAPKTFETLPLVKHFEDLGLITLRTSWDEDDCVLLSFKCGAPGGKKQWKKSWELQRDEDILTRGLSHQHADNNHFLIHGYDTYLAIDEGYNRTVKACEHSVITVDGLGYKNEGANNIWHLAKEEQTASITTFVTADGITYFCGDAHNMYKEEAELTQYDRHVIHTGKEHFYMIDELDSNNRHTYTFHLHTETPGTRLEDDIYYGIYEYKNGPGKMKVYTSITNDNVIETETKQTYVKAIMSAQEPDKFRDINMETLCLENATKERQMEFINVYCVGDVFKDYKATAEHICQGTTQGYKVESEGCKEIMLYARDGVIEYENIQAQAKILLIAGDKILIVDGTSCSINGEELYFSNKKDTVIIQEGSKNDVI
ncbi:MAG: hypothetical protein ATN33_01220 [Epulopiscium sp. Nele67-Bin001]|nr:MAG: hypothetical protein ATN33_01220 [Epulopiscium sp. Nele67-Bin001]